MIMRSVVKALAVLSAVTLTGQVGEVRSADVDCCSRCGCSGEVRTVCRPIYTTRTEEVVCWDVVSEEICLPRKSNCAVCGSTLGSDACCGTGELGTCEIDVPNYGCKSRPRDKLMRKTFIREVPVIVWVVEYVCPGCAGRDATASFPSHVRLARPNRSVVTDAGVEDAAAVETGGRPKRMPPSLFRSTSGQHHMRKHF